MKTLKTLIVVFLSMVLILNVGCSNSKDSSTSNNPVQTKEEAPTPQITESASKPNSNNTKPKESSPSTAVKPVSKEQMRNISFENHVEAAGINSVIKYWIRNDKMKMEMNYEGQNMVYYIDTVKNSMKIYLPSTNTVMSLSDPDELEDYEVDTDPLGDFSEHINTGIVKGTEVINGVKCSIYELSVDGVKSKYYVAEENGFPMKVEMDAGGVKTVSTFKNVKFNSVTDADVTLPSSAKAVDFGLEGLSDLMKK